MKTYSPQVRPHAQGNLCCQHTFTEAARPRGEGDPVGEKREKIRRIIWCRGKNLSLDVLINKHCCLIPFHLLQPAHRPGNTTRMQLFFFSLVLSSPHHSSLCSPVHPIVCPSSLHLFITPTLRLAAPWCHFIP